MLDYAILVISASDGVQSHTLTLWRLLQKYSVPTFLFINKMDLPDYVRRHLVKRAHYERCGINEWNNIRYIYSKDDSLNAAEIKHILLDWVVPKL